MMMMMMMSRAALISGAALMSGGGNFANSTVGACWIEWIILPRSESNLLLAGVSRRRAGSRPLLVRDVGHVEKVMMTRRHL